ncbi:MBL fold metallo-hydrolase [Roseisalinus antarcticus]|uniref:Metallo-beta-lactamase superfamily protein n=1 Tax=Roseisalinus antarcticus TaxID=254357 RepID=A0A1Y5RNH9_9RHOB|nr:MBL fold metallo-hydrolase [Roseisalinus antarcticus]SLN21552.1 Metallo-beta-lactamase superfamily protein [Roseisalinus antarcticus]
MSEPGAIRYPFADPPEEGTAIEVAEGILWMRLPLPMKLDHVNVYALDEGDSWTIVDTGVSSRRARALWERILAGPLGGKPVSRVIVTHHHPDHVGLAGWFREKGAEIWASRTAYLMARMLVLDTQEVWPEETRAFYRGAGMAEDMVARRLAERPFNFSDVVWPLPLGFRRMIEGLVVEIGGRSWDVRMGAGHAPEHVTLWARDAPLVLGGDQLLASISPNLGVYPTEPEADPVADWIAACRRLAAFATEDQLVLPGHKMPFRGLPARLSHLEDNHHGALERLVGHLVDPKTAGECFAPLFKREIGAGEYGLALVEAYAHCLHLWHLGRVSRERRGEAWVFHAVGAGG